MYAIRSYYALGPGWAIDATAAIPAVTTALMTSPDAAAVTAFFQRTASSDGTRGGDKARGRAAPGKPPLRRQALPGRVSFAGSRSRRASAGRSPPSSTASSTIDLPVRVDAFTISAARA